MKQNTADTPSFDTYLNKIEHLEKKRRRKRFLMLVPVALLIGAGFMFWDKSEAPSSDLSNAQFTSNQAEEGITRADNSEWLKLEPALPTESQEEEVSNESPVVEEEQQKPSVWFSMDISGRRQVRERLVYRIENFRPEFTYTIDFGNGVEREMRESITYRYPLPGHFDMKLTAVSPDGDTVEYIKKYEIVPASNSTTAQVSQP